MKKVIRSTALLILAGLGDLNAAIVHLQFRDGTGHTNDVAINTNKIVAILPVLSGGESKGEDQFKFYAPNAVPDPVPVPNGNKSAILLEATGGYIRVYVDDWVEDVATKINQQKSPSDQAK